MEILVISFPDGSEYKGGLGALGASVISPKYLEQGTPKLDFLPNFFAPLCEGEGGAEKISLKRLQQQKNIVHTLPFKAPDGEEIFIEIAFVG